MTSYTNTMPAGVARFSDEDRETLTDVFPDINDFEQEAGIWLTSRYGEVAVDVDGEARAVDIAGLAKKSGLTEQTVRDVLSYVGTELGYVA